MEKQPNRDELANKLKEIRNSDEENPEIAKAKARGYLEAMQTTDKYKEEKEAHLKDAKYYRDLLELKKNARNWLLESSKDEGGKEKIQKILDAVDFFIENGIYFSFSGSGRALSMYPISSEKNDYDTKAMLEDIKMKSGLDKEVFDFMLRSNGNVLINGPLAYDWIDWNNFEDLKNPLVKGDLSTVSNELKDALGLTLCMDTERAENSYHAYNSKLRVENEEELNKRFKEFAQAYLKTEEQKNKEREEKRQKAERENILKREIEELEKEAELKRQELGR